MAIKASSFNLAISLSRTGKWRWPKKNPHGLRLVKGNLHIAVNRNFVDYILHNPFAKVFLEWTKKYVLVPDETYFATLNHNPQLGIKGSFLGNADAHTHTRTHIRARTHTRTHTHTHMISTPHTLTAAASLQPVPSSKDPMSSQRWTLREGPLTASRSRTLVPHTWGL